MTGVTGKRRFTPIATQTSSGAFAAYPNMGYATGLAVLSIVSATILSPFARFESFAQARAVFAS